VKGEAVEKSDGMDPSITQAAHLLHSYLRPRQAEMVRLLGELVQIESHASQPNGVDRVGDLVSTRLNAAGFSVERARGAIVPIEDAWLAELMLPGTAYDSVADARVARKSGSGDGRALLLADLDTSYDPGCSTRFPFRVDETRAYGPGAADMKGGLVVLLFALEALEQSDLITPAATTVVLSPDEQAGSLSSRSLIELAAHDADWCLCVECARDGGNLMGSRAHIGIARLDVYGREAHAGSARASGINAIEALARKIAEISALTDPQNGVYLTVGEVHGGRRRSVVPGHAFCTIDVRTPHAGSWEDVRGALQCLADAPDASGARAELRMRNHRPGIPWTAATDALILLVKDAGQALALDFGVIPSSAAGSSSFAGAAGVPTLDGMGPAGGNLMTDREYVEIASLADRAALLALSMHLLATRPVTLPARS
jgi:glutamate carboxypeptidase